VCLAELKGYLLTYLLSMRPY